MLRQSVYMAALMVALCVAANAQPTVTVMLDSTQADQIVPPQSTVDWTITFSVSTGDNQGLALLSCDLVQNAGNPSLFDIPPADGVPTAMSNFSRPDGISNPGETDPNTGYIGSQRGTSGQMNLRQVGGAQNTFGEALTPGSGIAENANVVGGVGQGTLETLASGTFSAPTTAGTYTFSSANSLATVLTEVNEPPDFSPVIQATVDESSATFSFTVTLIGDVDLDCDVELSDLAQLLGNYGATTGMTWNEGDLDNDGDIDLSDLAALLGSYGLTCP
jgi:hypothetical protein